MAIRFFEPSAWSDRDQVEEAMGWAGNLTSLFLARDRAAGHDAGGYTSSPEVAAAHDLFCRLYDRLGELAPAATAFSASP